MKFTDKIPTEPGLYWILDQDYYSPPSDDPSVPWPSMRCEVVRVEYDYCIGPGDELKFWLPGLDYMDNLTRCKHWGDRIPEPEVEE